MTFVVEQRSLRTMRQFLRVTLACSPTARSEFPSVAWRGVDAGRGLITVVAGLPVRALPGWRLLSVSSAGRCARVAGAGRGWVGVRETGHGRGALGVAPGGQLGTRRG